MDRYLLHLLPREDDAAPLELDVTLNVGGATVSGNLITEDTYFALLAEKFETLIPGAREDLATVVDEAIQGHRDAGEELHEEDEAALRERAIEAGYRRWSDRMVRTYDRADDAGKFIHLRRARVRLAGRTGFESDLWRGKLEAIDGFAIGQVKPNHEA